MVFLYRVAQCVLEVVLDVGVDGEPQAVPLGGETLGLIPLLEGVAPGVHRREDDAVFAGEQVVILQFEARDARVVHVGEPQHRGQKLPLRVPALRVLIDTDAGDAVCLAEVPHGVGHGPVYPVAQEAVVGTAVAEFLEKLPFVQLQYLGQPLGREGEFILRHLPGRGPEGPAAAVGRQKNAVGAINAAPVGGDDGVPQLLAQGAVGVPAAAQHLQK